MIIENFPDILFYIIEKFDKVNDIKFLVNLSKTNITLNQLVKYYLYQYYNADHLAIVTKFKKKNSLEEFYRRLTLLTSNLKYYNIFTYHIKNEYEYDKNPVCKLWLPYLNVIIRNCDAKILEILFVNYINSNNLLSNTISEIFNNSNTDVFRKLIDMNIKANIPTNINLRITEQISRTFTILKFSTYMYKEYLETNDILIFIQCLITRNINIISFMLSDDFYNIFGYKFDLEYWLKIAYDFIKTNASIKTIKFIIELYNQKNIDPPTNLINMLNELEGDANAPMQEVD